MWFTKILCTHLMYKRTSFWLHHSIIVSQAIGRLRPVGFRFIETHQVVATKKLEIFDLQPVYMMLPFVVNVVTLSSPNAVQRVTLSTYAWPVQCSIMNDNQSRNLRTSDKPHWLRKLLRMAKVFSAKKSGPLCAVTL